MADAMIHEHEDNHGRPLEGNPHLAAASSSSSQQQSVEDQYRPPPTTNLRRKSSHPRSPKKKAVVIQLPPQTNKRRKVSTSISTKHVVELLHKSVSPQERHEALEAALQSFTSHNMQDLHDEALTAGADAALTKHLALVIMLRESQAVIHTRSAAAARTTKTDVEPDLDWEISGTCEALESIYRATTAAVSKSFHKVGRELLRLLMKVMDAEINEILARAAVAVTRGSPDKTIDPEEEEDDMPHLKLEEQSAMDRLAASGSENVPDDDDANNNHNKDSHQHHGGTILRRATKIMGHFARVVDATQPMAYFPGLLSSLLRLICLQPYDCIPAEARMNSLWILANLACNADNMVMMACHPGLVDSLVSMTFRSLHRHDTVETALETLRSQSIALRALLNLSWAPENRIPMAENTNLVQVLTSLSAMRKSPFPRTSRTANGIVLQTRRHAIGALRNLTAAPRRTKIRLCSNGMLLNVLTDAVLNDPDDAVRERAFCTIHNLAVHDTAVTMVQHPALILALKGSLQEDDDNNNNNINTNNNELERKMRASASGTLLVLERSITPDMDAYQNLRELLDVVNPTVHSERESNV